MSRRILLTAFKPFFGRHENRSETVCRRVRAGGNTDVDLLILPVDQQGEADFLCQLTQFPGGITKVVKTGGLISDVFPAWTDGRIERAAISPGQQVHGVVSLPWASKLESEFDRYLAMHIGNDGTRLTSSIGAYWCNRVYHRGLEWSGQHVAVPSVFLHLATAGDLDNQIQVVGRTVDLLRQHLL